MNPNLELIEETSDSEEEELIPFTLKDEEYYQRVVDTWIDLRFYVKEQKLSWLDKPNAFHNFLKLCNCGIPQ